MPFEDAATYRFNPFDLTKVWPHKDYPPITIGRMVLDRNPENFFAQIEQAAFEPSNMVPGIGPSPDKMLLGRLFSYADTHRYRIGTNYKQLPANAPNSYGGPQADPQRYPEPSWFASGAIMRSAYTLHAEDNDFVQAGNLYRDVMSETDREHLVTNIVTHMSQGVERFIQERAVKNYWYPVDPDLGARVARGLGLKIAPELSSSVGGE
jgi:catalase